jgi:ABC-type branched-subunit amino acid transport system permease subunit
MESRLLSPAGANERVDVYELRLAPKGIHRSEPHTGGTTETLTVLTGALRVVVGDEIYDLEREMTGTAEADLTTTVEGNVELDLYLRYLAACVLIGYQGQDQAGNYYAKPVGGGRFTVIPWDLNNATNLFYRLDTPTQALHETRSPFQSSAYDPYLQRQLENGLRRLGPTYRNVWSVPNTRIWDRPELRARLLDHLETFLATFFTEEAAKERVAALWALVGAHVATDPYLEAGDDARAPAFLADWVAARRAFLAAQLPALPSALANANLGLLPAIAVSALAALIVAAIFGGAIIRMTESTMAMATLALLVVVHTFFQNATTYTRGALGLAGIPVRTTIGVATVAAIVFVLISRLYKESGPGLRLRATREDPLSAASVGTNVVRTRYGVWLLSAAMMGAAGSLWAQSVIAFNANQFYFTITFALLAMLVVGGRTSLTGAVAGAAIITFLTDTLARVEQGVAIGPWELPKITGTVQFVIAFLIIITLILRSEGIFDRWEIDEKR